MAVGDKATNKGPLRGNNTFPPGNKARPNTSGRGGGGAGGDGTGIAASKVAKGIRDAQTAKLNKPAKGKAKAS
jgi:hypothetical protein